MMNDDIGNMLRDLKTVFESTLASGQIRTLKDARALCDLYDNVERIVYVHDKMLSDALRTSLTPTLADDVQDQHMPH